jgi:CDP-6-deoxy-D-xylo-4-hexulose-3-dehydrase
MDSWDNLLSNPVLDTDARTAALRSQVLALAADYARLVHVPAPFLPGVSPVPVSGKTVGVPEVQALVSSSLDCWLTTGRFNDAFEGQLADYIGVAHVLTVNSGSSANLVAIAALMTPELGDRALKAGDEVITVAAGFPTTVNPILQNGLVPVFVDVSLPTYNVNPDSLEQALSPRTRAVMLAHTLGNPFDVEAVVQFTKQHGLWLIEDCCDALGSEYKGQRVGTFGDIGTLSFYPAHHITTGEGGAVFTNNALLARLLASLRDWGRDCWCKPGHDNTCGKRYGFEWTGLPRGYDHKYVYTHLGYNLKMTDMQAAVGLAQMGQIEDFAVARQRNFAFLHEGLSGLQDQLLLPEPTPDSLPSWFGFPITLRGSAAGRRPELLRFLESRHIGSRLLFGGNLVHQPYMRTRTYRVAGPLATTETILEDTFWLGVCLAVTPEMLTYVVESLAEWGRGRPQEVRDKSTRGMS